MKFNKLICSSLILFSCFSGVSAQKSVQLVGHRGSDIGIENTLDAFRQGVKRGYKFLETDIRVTSDGHFVCSHDADLKEWGHAGTVVEKTNLATLQALELTQTRWGIEYKGKITTLEEYIMYCDSANVTPVVELKRTTGINEEDVSNLPKLLSVIQKKYDLTKCMFISFMPIVVQWLRENEQQFLQDTTQHLNLQFLCFENMAEKTILDSNLNTIEWCKKYKMDVDVRKGFDKQMVERCHQAGLKVNCWTIDDTTTFDQVVDFGVDMVTTNKIAKQ